ncbi:hypothetical protein Goshw_002295 [Gossypium schwendimanii]|uniref:Uncharacterized protein n=1 Tax=Gossypium schwendimanii TaxID=34291 RepID=A0A7J9M9M2_GOSSC|nr:hypothetical protein [Gossypium schwendimanii]
MLYAGPVVPEPPKLALEERWERLLSNFEAKTLIFCTFGSECVLKKDQFQELVLGLELTGLPFLVALKPPMGAQTIESALPEGFQERIINARLMAGDLRIGVEVEKSEKDGFFTKDDVNEAVRALMDGDSELGKEVRANHAKWKEFLLAPGLENYYINDFVMKLNNLM